MSQIQYVFLTEACVIHGILTMLCSIKAWSSLHSCTYWLIRCCKPVWKPPMFYSRLHKAAMSSPNLHNTKLENLDFIRAAHRDVHLSAALLDVGGLQETSTRLHCPYLMERWFISCRFSLVSASVSRICNSPAALGHLQLHHHRCSTAAIITRPLRSLMSSIISSVPSSLLITCSLVHTLIF